MSENLNKKDTTDNVRRELLKGLATIPILGIFIINILQKWRRDKLKKSNIMADFVQEKEAPSIISNLSNSKHLKLGIIGYGGRGSHLVRGAGFATKGWTKTTAENARKNKLDKAFNTFMSQEDLNCSLVGVCDLFDVNADLAIDASNNEVRPGGKPKQTAIRYRTHRELLANNEIDGVIIATPDHWHSRIAIDAAKAGKHVYVEKGLTRTFQEALDVYDVVKDTGIVFQLGHQNRQVEANDKAKQIIDQGLLGPINLVELTTNRNSTWGAWVWSIHPDANRKTIDWDTFQNPSPNKIPFGEEALKRYFRWRCWYDYGTGLSGDLFSHDYDQLNQIMNIGIPKYASASGGNYFYRDGRDVPDVWHATLEYPDTFAGTSSSNRNRYPAETGGGPGMTVLYSATLSSNNSRGNRIMGHDATMTLGGMSNYGNVGGFSVTADRESTLYRDRLNSGVINSKYPIYNYSPGSKQIDGVTSATSQYFANKGLLYTYRDGKRVDTTHLHIKDWLDSIRDGSQPKCNIEVAFQEGVTCAMATESYLKGKRIEWDPVNRRLI